MIEVSVKLISAIHPSRNRELARMEIFNVSEEPGETLQDYGVRTLRGRSTAELDKHVVTRTGTVTRYPSLAIHIWHLVHDALKAVNYNRRPKGCKT
jgi:hypothetical protein